MATALRPRSTGESISQRAAPVAISSVWSENPGAIARMSGPASSAPIAATTMVAAPTILNRSATKRRSSRASPRARTSAYTGMTAESSAPPASSMKIVSGMRNAAYQASASALTPNSALIALWRMKPSTRLARIEATMMPAAPPMPPDKPARAGEAPAVTRRDLAERRDARRRIGTWGANRSRDLAQAFAVPRTRVEAPAAAGAPNRNGGPRIGADVRRYHDRLLRERTRSDPARAQRLERAGRPAP